MKEIELRLKRACGDERRLSLTPPVLPLSILSEFGHPMRDILGLTVNNDAASLCDPLTVNSDISPILRGSHAGSQIYRHSLCFILATAAHRLYPDRRLLVGHSLGYAYYYTFADRDTVSEAEAWDLKAEMQALISADLSIEREQLSYRDTASRLEEMGLIQTRRQLDYLGKPVFKLSSLAGFSDLYFEPLVPRTSYIDVFDIMVYGEGFLLRYPTSSRPSELPSFVDIPALFAIYRYYKQWGKKLGIISIASLNRLIDERKITDFINISETLQDKRIADIAEAIRRRGNIKIVLMAGPSSSGKTTASKKLAMQLNALGYRPHVIELDSYYVEREYTPRDADGNYDYECLEALDIELLNQNLVDLFAGNTVPIPAYDFKNGKRRYEGKTIRMEEDDILIMEGIHGLNDKLTPLIDPRYKFKIYLSALTQLNIDDLNRISTRDNRLVRRIVRDAQFRGKTAADTISMWNSVEKGERLHIFPFQNQADAMLNTALDYELSVLKVYAEPLLRCVTPLQEQYAEASRLLRFLQLFSAIPASSVPSHSIIREFIGDSAFKY